MVDITVGLCGSRFCSTCSSLICQFTISMSYICGGADC